MGDNPYLPYHTGRYRALDSLSGAYFVRGQGFVPTAKEGATELNSAEVIAIAETFPAQVVIEPIFGVR